MASLRTVSLLVLAGALATLAPGAVPGGANAPVTVPPEERPGLMEAPAEALPPRLAQIRERLEREAAELAPLREAFAKANDPYTAAQIAARIHEIKTATEADVLGIQLEHARAEGHVERAGQLEVLLERHAAPREIVKPARSRREVRR